MEGGDRDGQLPVDVLEVFGGRVVVGHPDEAVGGEADLIAEGGMGPALGNVVADLPAELGQEPALAGEELGAAPRAEPGDDVRRREGLQPAQGRDPVRRVAAGQRGARAVNDQGAGEEHSPARQVDGRAGRGRNLIEREEVDWNCGVADRGAVRQGAQGRGLGGAGGREQPGTGRG